MKSYAFLGGAFDPIHIGHLRILINLSESFNYHKLFLLPYGVSPTAKQPFATPYARLKMASLAIEDNAKIGLEDTELTSNQPAYTTRTLSKLRELYGDDCHFSFIMGDDTYAQLDEWHEWKNLLNLTNILVINRKGAPPNKAVHNEEQGRVISSKGGVTVGAGGATNRALYEEFISYVRGKILKIKMPLMDISSTDIRAKIARGNDLSFLLPGKVLRYVHDVNLYQT